MGGAIRGASDRASVVVPLLFSQRVRPGTLRLPRSRFRPRPKHAIHGLDADVGTALERERLRWNPFRRRPRIERLRSERWWKRRGLRRRRRRELVGPRVARTPETEASGVRGCAQTRTKVDLPAPAAPAAAAASPPAAATVTLGPGFVDVQRATAELGAVDAADSRLGGRGVRHLDEGEAARAAGVAVGDDADAIHLAVSRKDVAELLLGDVERTITNVNLSHVKRYSYTKRPRRGLTEVWWQSPSEVFYEKPSDGQTTLCTTNSRPLSTPRIGPFGNP